MNMQSSTVASDLKAAIYKRLEWMEQFENSDLSDENKDLFLEFKKNVIDFMIGIIDSTTVRGESDIDKLSKAFAHKFGLIVTILIG